MPEIIKNGKQIDYQKNWKNRGYDTYIFAGPVTLMGHRAYVCTVVQKDSANRFYLHEVVDTNGNYILIDKDTGEIKTGYAKSKSTSAPISLSNDSISQDTNESNSSKQKTIRGRFSD